MKDPRFRLSADRTLLAWIRTTIGLMAFGFVVARLGLFFQEMKGESPYPNTVHISIWVGTILIILSAVINVIAVIEHVDLVRRIERNEEYVAPKWSLGMILSIILTALAVGLAGWLAYLGLK